MVKRTASTGQTRAHVPDLDVRHCFSYDLRRISAQT
jgi:hypothetical protein